MARRCKRTGGGLVNRQEIKRLRHILKTENARWPLHLVEVPRDLWPPNPVMPVAVWRSRSLLVQVYAEANDWIRLSICRSALKSNGAWQDGLTWDQLQRIKGLCGYGDRQAIEIYPADSDVINVANIRHLWLPPEPLDVGWKKGQAA